MRNSKETILKTEDLTKEFGGLTAVDRVGFEMERGSLHCLIGPNGAGKSTLFKLITGRHTPTDGKVLFCGEEITDVDPHKRVRKGLSMKFQDVKIFRDLTVNQNLKIALQQYTADRKLENKRDELLGEVGLKEKRDMIAGNLSHGEQQWLEIAMAVSPDPDLLLLDEPAAGMSVEDTDQTKKLIRSLNDDGISILIVEHNIKFVREISDIITVLHNGSIFAEGQAEEIESNAEIQRIYLGESN